MSCEFAEEYKVTMTGFGIPAKVFHSWICAIASATPVANGKPLFLPELFRECPSAGEDNGCPLAAAARDKDTSQFPIIEGAIALFDEYSDSQGKGSE